MFFSHETHRQVKKFTTFENLSNKIYLMNCYSIEFNLSFLHYGNYDSYSNTFQMCDFNFKQSRLTLYFHKHKNYLNSLDIDNLEIKFNY